MTFPRSAWIISKAFIQEFGWLSGGRSILHGAWQLLKAAFTPESDLSRARMESCRKCVMYDSEMDTCGHVPEVYGDLNGKRHTSGCWCLCRFATKLPEKTCWARFHKLDFGWPDELLPKK